MRFTLLASDGEARRGRIETAHGAVETPAFMPVGTAATVKAMMPEQVSASGADIILGNTYHLMLRPGADLIERLGGLHHFMNWPKPILTDSGGFQVMSLAELRRVSERGVAFRSHIDGANVELTPEGAIAIQRQLGSDIAMVLDECIPSPADRATAEKSMRLSLRWAERSKRAYVERAGAGLFGIVQGGTHADLRRASAEALVAMAFDGYAVGGLAVGEGRETMFRVLEDTLPHLPRRQPRYLMGVGKPEDLVGAVARGVDMFDCVLPTRSGRTSQAFTRRGPVNLRNARHREDPRPLDPECPCPACACYSRAYLNHLCRSGEMLAGILLSLHNLTYYQDLMRELREAIAAGRLDDIADAFHDAYAGGDPTSF